MSGTRHVRAAEKPEVKNNTHVMSVTEKTEVLDKFSREIRITAVGSHYRLNESMTRYITKS
jgi:hypothetical protein